MAKRMNELERNLFIIIIIVLDFRLTGSLIRLGFILIYKKINKYKVYCLNNNWEMNEL